MVKKELFTIFIYGIPNSFIHTIAQSKRLSNILFK